MTNDIIAPSVETIGNGYPVVGLVAGIHGNERVGLHIFTLLKKNLSLRRGTVQLITANPYALAQNKRFIDADLNRVFPGKSNGNIEEQLANKLIEIGKGCDYLIDLHSCSVESEPFCIVRQEHGQVMHIAERTKLPAVVVYPLSLQKGGSFIDYVACGIGMELGLHEKEETVLAGYHAVVHVLYSLGLIASDIAVQIEPKKQRTFRIIGHLTKTTPHTRYLTLDNFSLISKGDKVGENEEGDIIATQNFYPVLSNEAAYKDNGGWMAELLSECA